MGVRDVVVLCMLDLFYLWSHSSCFLVFSDAFHGVLKFVGKYFN